MKLKRVLALALVLLLVLGDTAFANDYFAKATTNTTIYKSASKSSSKVASIDSGTWLFISEIKDGWAKVTYNGKSGYAASATVKKTAKAVYVKSGTAVIYKSADSNSTKLITVPYGTKLDAYYKTGNYTHVAYNGKEGFISTSSIQLTSTNTLDKTVYLQASSGKVYASPSTSANSASVSGTTALKAVAQYDSWYRVTYGSKVGFVKKSDVGTSKYTASSSTKSTQSSSSSSASSSSTSTTTNKTMYVKTGYVNVYKSASTSSANLGFIPYGCKVTVKGTDGSFSKVTYGSLSGYCKTSGLGTSDPNNLSNTVYVTDKSVKIYKAPTTGAESTTVSTTTALKQTARLDSSWSRVTYNGNVGFVKTSQISTKKGFSSSSSSSSSSSTSTSSAASGKSKSVDWFKGGIQSEFYKGRIATVTDVKTGISWKVKRKGGTNHADVEPLTAADTAAMKKACGSDFLTWHRRAIWVSLNGNKYAASMNCMAHGLCNIKDNNFDGHFCIHFTNSRTHGSDKVDADHQAAIKRALAAG